MRLRNRFTLVAIGFLTFVIVGPAIVFLAQGFRYDFSTGKIIKTGTLVVKTDPKGAQVLLDGEIINNTPFIKRFAVPGEYSLEIIKENYRPWVKKISILPQQVLYLPQRSAEIALFYQNPQSALVSTTTLDFFTRDQNIFFVEKSISEAQKFYFYSSGFDDRDQKTLIASTTTYFISPKILGVRDANADSEFLIASGEQIWHVAKDAAYLISANLQNPKLGLDAGTIYAVNQKSQLVELRPKVDLRVIRDQVANFTVINDRIYYISTEEQPGLYQILPNNQNQSIFQGLPHFLQSQIIVTPERDILVVLDHDLYQVGETLRKINSGVKFSRWDEAAKSLLYGNDNEVWSYSIRDNSNELLTRSSEGLGNTSFNRKIFYLFSSENDVIKATEFDASGQPNVYSLVEAKKPDPKFYVNGEGAILLYLDGADLIILKIR